MKSTINRFKKYQFLFEELVKRDFKQKYKRTVLGMGWSLLSPLLQLFVMNLVFKQFFGRTMNHYSIYLFCGNIVFNYFKESTNNGMRALLGNAAIFSKVNVPKYMFVLSRNISSLINFGLTLVIFFIFVIAEKIPLGLHMLRLLYPIICLVVFNVGIGLILSALFVFFRDLSYLYDIFTLLLMYMSAIFYTVDTLSVEMQRILMINPIYSYIRYFRIVVLEGAIPPMALHLQCAGFAVAAFAIGVYVYKKYNHRFLYYV